MYCPNCAAQNGDQSQFCRVCGSNLSLIPQAMSGQLPVQEEASCAPILGPGGLAMGASRRRRGKVPSQQRAISSIFMGFGFAIVALALVVSGEHWGIWMLIPAFSMLGSGVAMYLSVKSGMRPPQQPFVQRGQPVLRSPTTGELTPPPPAGRLAPPPSVTEGTTRIFDHSAEASDRNG